MANLLFIIEVLGIGIAAIIVVYLVARVASLGVLQSVRQMRARGMELKKEHKNGL